MAPSSIRPEGTCLLLPFLCPRAPVGMGTGAPGQETEEPLSLLSWPRERILLSNCTGMQEPI